MIIDSIVIGLIVLFAIMGLCKGFIKSIVSFFKGATGTVVSVLLSKPIAALLTNLKINQALATITEKFGLINNVLTESAFNEALAGGESVTGAVLGGKMTGAVSVLVKAFFGKLFTAEATYATYADFSSKFYIACGTILLIVLSFILAMILLNIALAILIKLFTNSAEQARFGITDRLLGLLFGLLKGLLVVVIVMVAFNISSLIPIVGSAIENMIAEAKFTSMIYEKVSIIIANIASGLNFNPLIK